MRTIKSEIQQYMTSLVRDGAVLTSHFAFPAEFIGFQGHFPQQKILPGVCQLQLALSTIEKETGKAVALQEVILAKYFAPVFPDDEITCVINDFGDCNGACIVRAAISNKAVKIAELKLRISYEARGNQQP